MSGDHEGHKPPNPWWVMAPYLVFIVCAVIAAHAAGWAPRDRGARSVAVFFGLAALVLPLLLALQNRSQR